MFPESHINLLQSVSRPLKYCAQETNLNKKKISNDDDLEKYFKILLFYPGLYEQMLNDPWFESLYHILNEQHNFLVDFIFLPDNDFLETFKNFELKSDIYQMSTDKFDLLYFYTDHCGQIPAILQLLKLSGSPSLNQIQNGVFLSPQSQVPAFENVKHISVSSGNPETVKLELINLFDKFKKNQDGDSNFKTFWKKQSFINEGNSEDKAPFQVKKTISPLISWVDTISFLNKFTRINFEIPLSCQPVDFPFNINLKGIYSVIDWKIFSLYCPFWSWIKDRNWFEPLPAVKIKSWPVTIDLNDKTKTAFITFVKKYPFPVVISETMFEQITENPDEFFRFVEKIYINDWHYLYLFLNAPVNENTTLRLTSLHKQLNETFGKLKFKYFIIPDFSSLSTNSTELSSLVESYAHFSKNLVENIPENEIAVPAPEYLSELLTLFQENRFTVNKGEKNNTDNLTGLSECSCSGTDFSNEALFPENEKASDGTENKKLGFNGKPIQFGRAAKRIEVVKPLMKKLLRIKYIKGMESRFISHSEVIRIFEKLCKKAGIKIIYKQGKNPRPRMSFAPPLNAGFKSEAEYMDLHLEISENDSLKLKLNTLLPKGIQIIEEKLILEKTASLSSAIEQNDYHITGFDFFDSQWITDFMGKNSVSVLRIKENETVLFDVRPFVEKMDWENDTLAITIKAIDSQMARLIEILEALLPREFYKPHQLSYTRIRQYAVKNGKHVDPIDLM